MKIPADLAPLVVQAAAGDVGAGEVLGDFIEETAGARWNGARFIEETTGIHAYNDHAPAVLRYGAAISGVESSIVRDFGWIQLSCRAGPPLACPLCGGSGVDPRRRGARTLEPLPCFTCNGRGSLPF